MMSGRESLFYHAAEGQKGVWETGAMRDIPGRMLFLSCLDSKCLSCFFVSSLRQGWQCCLWATLSRDNHGCLSLVWDLACRS